MPLIEASLVLCDEQPSVYPSTVPSWSGWLKPRMWPVVRVRVGVVEAEDVADLVDGRGLEVVALPAGAEDVVLE